MKPKLRYSYKEGKWIPSPNQSLFDLIQAEILGRELRRTLFPSTIGEQPSKLSTEEVRNAQRKKNLEIAKAAERACLNSTSEIKRWLRTY